MQLHKDMAQKGVVMIGLSYEPDSKVGPHIKGDKTPYIIGAGTQRTNDAYGVRGFPTAFVIDPAGKITFIGHPADPKFKEAIEETLKNTPPKPREDILKEMEVDAAKALEKAAGLVKKKKYADALEAYEKVADDYADTASGKKAKAELPKIQKLADNAVAADELRKADRLVEDEKFTEAIKAYEAIVDNYADTTIAKQAKAKIREIKADKSVGQKLREAQAKKKCTGWLQMARGMVHNGKKDQARVYYQKIIDEFGDTSFAATAREEMSRL